jgi:hypothetical protein
VVVSIDCAAAFPVVGQADTMMENWINYPSAILLALGLFWLLLSDSRRSIVTAYSVIVILVFTLNIQFWTFGFALSKLLTALMAMLIMILNPAASDLKDSEQFATGRIFRATGLVFFVLLISLTTGHTSEFLNLSVDQTFPALSILVCGFLLLATTQDPFRVIIGLMTMLIGFEIIYGSVEQSLLVNGLLAAVFLLIAMVGVYLTTPKEKGDQL